MRYTNESSVAHNASRAALLKARQVRASLANVVGPFGWQWTSRKMARCTSTMFKHRCILHIRSLVRSELSSVWFGLI